MQPLRDKLISRMRTLAASYVPEWQFGTQDPDAGSVVALLYSQMLEGSLERYGKVLHKHKIQYLNLFDRFKEEPVESAKSFVQFTPTPGAAPVYVPKGTRLFAESKKIDRQVVFETAHGIVVNPANISAIFTTEGGDGPISCQFSHEEKQELSDCSFTIFHGDGDDLTEHVFIMGFTDALDSLERLDIELLADTATEDDLERTLDILCGEGVRFGLLTENGFEPFDAVERKGAAIRLRRENFNAFKAPLAGRDCCQIAISSDLSRDIQLSGVSLRFSGADIVPDEVRCGGVTQNVGHFHPFGVPMEIYAACEFEARAVFARKGAKTKLSFSLDFEIAEQLLPEFEVETEYKVIMKRQPVQQKPIVQEIRADYVLFEYLSATGWKRICQDEQTATLFNGSARGELSIPFVMPGDMISEEYAAGQPRMRLRLLKAEGLYRVPSRQNCPVIDNLRFSYSHERPPLSPSCAVLRNNFQTLDALELFKKGQGVTLFYSVEHEKPAVYLGFDENPWGTPLSVYIGIGQGADYPVDFTTEYLSPSGFIPVKVSDGTGGMLHSGSIRMIIDQDAERRELFGRELYWIRLVNHTRESKSYRLPRVTGIYQNMAAVENICTITEHFYLDSSESAVSVRLGQTGLISAKVYVNEQSGADGENWVLWQKSQHREQQGRVYDIDFDAGTVSFAKNIFAAYPVREDGPAIKVISQSYQGGAANVEAGSINTLGLSIRNISSVENPVPAFGGYDAMSEESSAAVISNMLRTRGRAVSRQDYYEIISQISCGVRRIRCISGVNRKGENQDNAVTIAILMDEYEKGGHIFSGVRQSIHEKLLECSCIAPVGRELHLTQPRFVRMSARLWILCRQMEKAYDLQKECADSIREFIDPLRGGFGGDGWEIGRLPTPAQLVAYLKIKHPDTTVEKIVVTAVYDDREYDVDDDIARWIASPFAMAVNGEHVVYIRLMEEL